MRALLVPLVFAVILPWVFWAGADAGGHAEQALRRQLTEPRPAAPGDLAAAISIPDAAARARAIAAVLEESGPGDLDEVLRIVLSAGASTDPLSLALVADWWAAFAPEEAYEQVTRWEFRDVNVAIFTVVRRWASQDPAAARAAVEKVEDDRRTALVLEALLLGWADRGPRQACWDYLEKMEPGIFRQKGIQVLVSQMLLNDGTEATLEFIESLPNDSLARFKLQAFRRTGSALARHAPARATEFAMRHADGPHGNGLLRLVARTRTGAEGAPGIEWLLTAAPSEARDEAMSKAYRRWLNTDRESAIAWLLGAKANTALEPAQVMLVGILGRDEPSAALATLTQMHDPGLRQNAQIRLARAWLVHDREAASNWLAGSELPEDLQASLLEGEKRLPSPARGQQL